MNEPIQVPMPGAALPILMKQGGKDKYTLSELGDIHCHHKLPRYLGGTDEYKNLVIVCENIHRLIHATTPETIRKYMEKLKLTPKQLKKLEKLRSLAHVESCLQFDAI